MFSGCNKENDPPAISVADENSLTQQVFADNEQGSSVSFTTTSAWTSSISAGSPSAQVAQTRAGTNSSDWISISPDHGNAGTHTVAITLETNTTGSDRTATITISCNGKDIIITVTQKATKEDGNPYLEPPVLTTAAVSNITATTATAGGNISDAGTPPYTERGVCYATAPNPTVADIKVAVSGTSVGSFATELTGLVAGTTYYVRAFAINSAGTIYGNQVGFTTEAEGVLINGVLWAEYNVDAPGTFAVKPEAPGMLYQWNRRVGWNASDPMINSNGGSTWDTSTPTGNVWEKANDPSPAGWRVPTYEELCKLKDEEKVTSEWVTQNGVLGKKFTDKSTDNTIFLPAVGCRFTSTGVLELAENGGLYWSSTPEGGYDDVFAYFFYFRNDGLGYINDYNGRRYGFSIRSVAE